MDIKMHKHKTSFKDDLYGRRLVDVLHGEYKSKKDELRAKIIGSDDLSLRRMIYYIIPFFDCVSSGGEKIEEFYKKIVEEDIMDRLKSYRIINWWSSFCNLLYVSRTKTANYDTLYASASIGMWGFEDTESLLKYCKKELKNNLEPSGVKSLWKFEMEHMEVIENNEFKYDSSDQTYKRHLLQIDMPEDRAMHADLNTYILSNALRRPIIIFGLSFLHKSNFMSIYLPLNHDPSRCCKHPLLMAWYKGKYYPILQEEHNKRNGKDLVPLNPWSSINLANVHFLGGSNSERNEKLSLVEKYMDVITVTYKFKVHESDRNGFRCICYCARIGLMDRDDLPLHYKLFKRYKFRKIGVAENIP